MSPTAPHLFWNLFSGNGNRPLFHSKPISHFSLSQTRLSASSASSASSPSSRSGAPTWPEWQRLWPLLLGLSLLGIGGYLLFIHYRRPTAIQRIEVQGAKYLQKAEIIEMSRLKAGQVYPYTQLEQISYRLEAHPIIRKAEMKFQGTTLHLQITERECLALVKDPQDGSIFEIDRELAILSRNSPRCDKIPFIRGNFRRTADRFDDQTLYRLASIFASLKLSYPELGERISELRQNSDQSTSMFLQNSRLRVNLPVEIGPREINRLYASIAYFEQSGLKSGILDLRRSEGILLPGK